MTNCLHCGMDLMKRNASGKCDHLYYPQYCNHCKEKGYTVYGTYNKEKEING
jgi:hypothetical protein